MQVDWFTLIAQVVNLLVLVGLLKHFLFGRIVRAMNEREATIAGRLEEAARGRALAQQEAESLRAKHRELEEQREQILAFQQLVRRVPAADAMIEYAKRLVRKTRVTEADTPDFINKWVTWGAGPRASMNLILAAKARAILHGEAHVSWDDIRAVAKPVLRHRIILNFAAQAERISTDDIIEQLLGHVGEKE